MREHGRDNELLKALLHSSGDFRAQRCLRACIRACFPGRSFFWNFATQSLEVLFLLQSNREGWGEGDLAPPPPLIISTVQRPFWLSPCGRGRGVATGTWRVSKRSPGCCSAAHHAQDTPTRRSDPAPSASAAEAGNPALWAQASSAPSRPPPITIHPLPLVTHGRAF